MAGPAYFTGVMNLSLNEDWAVPFVYSTVDANGNITGGVDLTGSTIKLEIREAESDRTAIVSVTSNVDGMGTPDGIFISTPPTLGSFWIVIDRNHSWRLAPGSYTVDLIRLLADGYQERIWEGQCTVVQGTTR
jgi:hypothetical protein